MIKIATLLLQYIGKCVHILQLLVIHLYSKYKIGAQKSYYILHIKAENLKKLSANP